MKRLLCSVPYVLLLIASCCLSNVSAELVKYGDAVQVSFDLANSVGAVEGYESIYGKEPSVLLTGDTYNVAPLIQTAASAFYLSSPGNVLQTFNGGAGKPHGASGAYAPGAANIVLSESLTPLGGNQFLVQVQLTSVGSAGPNAWVPAGVSGPGGAIFTSWRMDLGTAAAAADRLLPAAGLFSIDSATMTLFNSAGGSIASFAMSNNASNLAGLAGQGVVGLNGANIAGFDLASYQLAWRYTAVPEPAAGLTAGLFGLLGACWRKRRS